MKIDFTKRNNISEFNKISETFISSYTKWKRANNDILDTFVKSNNQIQNTTIKKNENKFTFEVLKKAVTTLFRKKNATRITNVEFKEAKNIKEAIDFAKKNFGMKLDVGDNLFTANIINEICTDVSNKMKGKAIFPDRISIKDDSFLGKNHNGGYHACTNEIYLNKNLFTDDSRLRKNFEKLDNPPKWLNFLVNRGDSYNIISNCWDNSSIQYKKIEEMRHCIYHELGHCNHYFNNKIKFFSGIFMPFGKFFSKDIEKLKKLIDCSKMYKSEYYEKNPQEFVAETFALKMEGKSIPIEIEHLYKKYGGA